VDGGRQLAMGVGQHGRFCGADRVINQQEAERDHRRGGEQDEQQLELQSPLENAFHAILVCPN
jgi:hypothetical protein